MALSIETKYRLLTVALAALALCIILVSAGMGYVAVSAAEVIRVVAAKATGNSALLDGIREVVPFVVMDVRLPRILTAALVGAGLAMSGVVYQGLLLNPLADPYTLGISSGAAFGASLALVANLSLLGQFSVPLFAFVGAVATLFVVLYLSSFNGQLSANTLILSGVIVGAILAAGISFLKYLADEQVAVIIFWLMGSFASRTWSDVGLVALAVVLGTGLTFFYAGDLNIMSLGARSSDSLGVETGRVRKILLLTASLVTAICVSVSGIIGFVGLIVPHLMRFLVGPDNRKLLPVSILAGAGLLLLADTFTRAVLPAEVPIGVLTALIGGPFFCDVQHTLQIFNMARRRVREQQQTVIAVIHSLNLAAAFCDELVFIKEGTVVGKERILAKAGEIDIFLAQHGRMNPVDLGSIVNEPGFQAIRAIRQGRVYLVDERIVSRPTLRIIEGISTIGSFLYPEIFGTAEQAGGNDDK